MTYKPQESKHSMPFFGIPKLWPYIRPYRKRIIFMIILGIISSLIGAIYPLFNRYVLNHFIGESTLSGLVPFILLYVGVLVFQVTDDCITLGSCGTIEVSVNRDLRDAAFAHLQELSFSYYNQNSVGYIHSRVMSDTAKIGETVAWHMMDIVWNGAYIVSILAVMFFSYWQLGVAILGLALIAALLSFVFQKKLVTINRKIREINGAITGRYNEGLTGISSIKALHVEQKMKEEFGGEVLSMKEASLHSARISAFFTASVTWISSLALALVLWQGGSLTKEGLMLLGTLSVFMTYAISTVEPIQNIMSTITQLITISTNIERFVGLMDTPSNVVDTPEVVEKYGDTFNPKKENWEPLLGEVTFSHVSFTYPDGTEEVLHDFSLHVKKGDNVAIVGETGAGKSTLVNLVCRFYEPTKGQVLIDGRDARERSQLWLHSHIGYVLQTPHLFSGSVRENLCYGKTDATDEEIWEALKLVSADEVVRRMKKGLDTEVGEGGSLLSTGEKQLISFARAILSDPAILVLDEATSSVDTVTEQKIKEAIAVLTKDRTSFVIAHRLSTIVGSDIILVVSDGRIVEQGTHRELMEQKGQYYSLYSRQFEGALVDQVAQAST